MPPTLGGRLVRAWMVTLLMGVAAICLLATWALPRQDRLAAERHVRLVSTTGTVHNTEIRKYDERRKGRGRRIWWEVEVWYTFEVEGRQQAGVNASFTDREVEFATEQEALDFAASFPAGRVVRVWYDPANPVDSARDPAYEPVAFLVPWALAVGAISAALGSWVVRRTLKEARKQPLPPSERYRALRIVAGGLALVAVSAGLLLVADLAPRAWHLWRQRSLQSGTVYLSGDLDVGHHPTAPVVRYYFRPDMAHPTVFVNGDAWRFGSTEVGSGEEALAIVTRIGEDYRADRLVVYFDPREPTFNALSREFGSLLSPRGAIGAGLALVFCLVALLRLRPAMARLHEEQPAPS